MKSKLEHYRRLVSKEEINTLPMVSYEGDIFVVETEADLRKALMLLETETIIGFDTEAKPSFKKGKSYPTSLVQLAGANVVIVIQLIKVPFGKVLAEFLSLQGVVKAGVAIHEDVRLLQKLYPFEPRSFIDIADMARSLELKTYGLRTLAANLLGYRISKSAQCSNWQKKDLSRQQILYAATDAWVSRELYINLCFIKKKLQQDTTT